MDKLLKDGKITQEQYDEFVVKEVTIGTGYNDLGILETEKEKMRIKDLSAWDNGRLIELYRLAVGAGYINKADALTAAKPSIDLLAKTYTSWDDYFAHYFEEIY